MRGFSIFGVTLVVLMSWITPLRSQSTIASEQPKFILLRYVVPDSPPPHYLQNGWELTVLSNGQVRYVGPIGPQRMKAVQFDIASNGIVRLRKAILESGFLDDPKDRESVIGGPNQMLVASLDGKQLMEKRFTLGTASLGMLDILTALENETSADNIRCPEKDGKSNSCKAERQLMRVMKERLLRKKE